MPEKKLLILGAGGFGQTIAEVAELLGNWDEFGLLIAIAVMGAFIIYFNDKK